VAGAFTRAARHCGRDGGILVGGGGGVSAGSEEVREKMLQGFWSAAKKLADADGAGFSADCSATAAAPVPLSAAMAAASASEAASQGVDVVGWGSIAGWGPGWGSGWKLARPGWAGVSAGHDGGDRLSVGACGGGA
jgi:hypothetical protein